MNKKLKWIIPFAVLSLTCGVAAGITGCKNDKEHTHDYSVWKSEGNKEGDEHWKECPDDGAIDESTRAEHVFVAGECECGAIEEIEEVKYGSATGQVKLHKLGTNPTDYSDVTVTIDDDDVNCELDKTTGKFTVTDAVVGKDYNLTVSKPGYVDYTVTVSVEEGEPAVIGGARGAVLEYKVFDSLVGYDIELHDHSKVNEANPTIGVNGNGSKSLDVISTDSYDDVSVSINAKEANGGNIQGIVLKFEDGTYAILNVHIGERKLQYRPEMWGMKSVFGNKWIEWTDSSVVTDAEKGSFESEDGLEIKLVRKGGDLYGFLDGRFIGKTALPEERAEDKINVGFFSFDVKANAVWNYEITETLPALESTITPHVTQPEDVTECTVTANPQKDTYAFGEEVELTFTAPAGYSLTALTVNGEDKFGAVASGKLIVLANRASMNVEATFTKDEPIALNLTVKGKKLGTTAALAKDTVVKFKGTDYTFTVGDNGAISADSVVKGRYTVVVDGYLEKEIVVDEQLNEITLEYDAFTAGEHHGDDWNGNYGNPANIDKTHVNDAEPYFTINDGASDFYQYTKTTYTDVSASVTYVQGTADKPGIGLVFDENKAVMIRFEKQNESSTKAQWIGGGNWEESNINNNWDFGDGEANFNPLSSTLMTKYASEGLELKLVKVGLKVCAFVDGNFAGEQTLPDTYHGEKCRVVFFAGGVSGGKEVHFGISEDDTRPAVTITDSTGDEATAHGTVTFDKESYKLGDAVTVTVTPTTDYVLNTLTVGGQTVTAKTDESGVSTYEFVATADTQVAATFVEATFGNIDATITGHKFGVNGNAITDGTEITLTGDKGTYKISVASGKISKTGINAGTYTVTLAGYQPATVTIEKDATNSEAITLEYDMFRELTGWSEHWDYSKQNDATAEVGFDNDCAVMLTKETYDDIKTTLVLDKTALNNGNGDAGLIFRFVGEGFAANGEQITICLAKAGGNTTYKIQVKQDNLWGTTTIAAGSVWNNLYYFADCNDDDAARTAGTNAETHLAEYETGTLELSVVRNGSAFSVYLGNDLIGTHEINAKYADAKCEIGFYAGGVTNYKNDNKGASAENIRYNYFKMKVAEVEAAPTDGGDTPAE